LLKRYETPCVGKRAKKEVVLMKLVNLFKRNEKLPVKITTKEIDVRKVAHSTYNRGFAPLHQVVSTDEHGNKQKKIIATTR